MRKQGSFKFTLSLLCTAALALLANTAHAGPYVRRAPYWPGSLPREHALILEPFPSDKNSVHVMATPQGAVRNGFAQPNHYRYAHCPVNTSIRDLLGGGASEGNGVPESEHRVFVYTTHRSLLLCRGRKLLAAYPVAVGRDNAWLDGSNTGVPIELAGRTYRVKRGDSLWSISRRFDMDIWTLASFNALSIESPLHPGQRIKIPKRPIHITPYGTFKITNKLVNPLFRSGQGTVQPFFRDKENILGSRWIGLSNSPYGIHGTNSREVIGTYSTRGCIRMFNEHIEHVFNLVRVGLDVVIQRTRREAQVLGSGSD